MRRGLTLLEVVVALAIAGLIALAARAALTAGLDTQERLQQHATRTEGDARFRALVVQSLRHLADAPLAGVPPFALRDTLVGNERSHVAEFYSRGLTLPAGTGAVARVRLAPSVRGLTISASSSDGSEFLHGVAPGLRAMHARLRAPGSGAWLDAWPQTLQNPAAVILEFNALDASSSGSSVPVVVLTGLEERP